MSDSIPVDAELKDDLTPRQREILGTLVREYVASAVPIGSGTIRTIGDLNVSSATIRNELVVLEDLGYVSQPHTSAGRIPTIKGYRLFVEQIMTDAVLPLPERRMIRHQFHQLRLDVDQWMQLTAAVLSHTAHAAALVTPPRATFSRFRHIELISVSEHTLLLVLVLQDSTIHQEMLTTTRYMPQSQLSATSNELNALLYDLSEGEIVQLTSPEIPRLEPWQDQVLERVISIMRSVDQQAVSRIYSDGVAHVLQEPEFVDGDRSRRLVQMIEERAFLRSILTNMLGANGVQVIIGGEGGYDEMDDVSLVLSPYGVRGAAGGVLGILGPTRMAYGRAVSTVRYVAQVMSNMVTDLYGPCE